MLRLVEGSKLDPIPYVALSYTRGVEVATEDERANIKDAATMEKNSHQRREGFPMAALPGIQSLMPLDWHSVLVCDTFESITFVLCPPPIEMRKHRRWMKFMAIRMWRLPFARVGKPWSRYLISGKPGDIRLVLANYIPGTGCQMLTCLWTRSACARIYLHEVWTLQEERLTPRMLYVCGQRMYWSCLVSQHVETGQIGGLTWLPCHDRFA